MRAVTHSADPFAGNAGPKCTRRPTAAMPEYPAEMTARPAGPCSSDGRHRLWRRHARRHRACRTGCAASATSDRARETVRSRRPREMTDARATQRSRARSPPDANGADARPAWPPTDPGLQAFRASESRGQVHAKGTPSARHTRSTIACGQSFCGVCVPLISRQPRESIGHRRGFPTSIISARQGTVKRYRQAMKTSRTRHRR
jgi:hypothetical protein